MRNQPAFPPQVSITIPDDFLLDLSQRFGDCNAKLKPWIAISLIHPTHLNESKIISIDRHVLDTLDSLAASFLELMLFDIAHENNSLITMADYAQFVQGTKQNIMQIIFDDFNLGTVSLTGKGEKNNPSNRVKATIARQFFGALLLCYGYDLLKPIVSKIAQEINSDKTVFDYKTILQEYTQAQKRGDHVTT